MADLEPREFPIEMAHGEDDPRFNFGLLVDVAELLERHGYPKPVAMDVVHLRGVLFDFLYKLPPAVGESDG
jgi:hypothetical protein